MKRVSVIFSLSIFLWVVIFSSCGEDDNPTPTAVTYSADIATIMNNYCITCHSGAEPTADLSLDNYINVKTVAESGILITRINDGTNPMPPSGLMPEDKRQKIQEWIDDGLQQ